MGRKRAINGDIVPSYKANPFLTKETLLNNIGDRITWVGDDKSRFIYSIDRNGEATQLANTTVIGIRDKVDRQKFAKIFAGGVAALFNLSSAGRRVFALIFQQIQAKQERDTVMLAYDVSFPMSKTTFYAGVKSCLQAGLIAQSIYPGVYYINPAFVFNGDRLTLLHQYEIDNAAKLEQVPSGKKNDNFDRQNVQTPDNTSRK